MKITIEHPNGEIKVYDDIVKMQELTPAFRSGDERTYLFWPYKSKEYECIVVNKCNVKAIELN